MARRKRQSQSRRRAATGPSPRDFRGAYQGSLVSAAVVGLVLAFLAGPYGPFAIVAAALTGATLGAVGWFAWWTERHPPV